MVASSPVEKCKVSKNMSRLWIILGLFIATGTTFPCRAQTVEGALRGVVVDRSGAVLPGVEVTLLNSDTNLKRLARTGMDGYYTFVLVPPGRYRLEAELRGFKKLVRRGIRLRVGDQARLDFFLEVGSLTEEITVLADVPLTQMEDPGLATVIENYQIVNLPLNGRNFLELSLLVPGAFPNAPGSPGSGRGNFSVNVNGAREEANNFLLDGVYNMDPVLNSFALSPPVDAIREFKLQTSTYDATFGRSAGAQVNVVLKSGTNQFHGTVYEFFRNAVLDARNFFDDPSSNIPKFQQNQFGFSLGGPIRHDRTFFFVDYEGRRRRKGITRIANVPTLAERRGDFSSSPLPPFDPFTGQFFSEGVIPDFRQHPAGAAIANLFPEPNRPVVGQNFVSAPTLRDRDDSFDARIDHSFSDQDTLAGRYSFSDRDLFEPFAGRLLASVPGYGNLVPRRAQNLMLNETHIFGSRWVNDLRLAFNRVSSGTFQENAGTDVNGQLGIPSFTSNPRDFGLSFITVAGFSPLGDEPNNPQRSVTNTFQVLNQSSFSTGKHLIRFGVDVRRSQQNAFRDVQSRGFINFLSPSFYTGIPLADLLLGLPSFTGGAQLDNPQYLRTTSVNLFVHENWRLLSNLTVNLGLRYEYNSPPSDRFDHANLFDVETATLVGVGQQGIPRGGYEPDRNNFAPRIGLSWSPFDGGRTVLRAGYGVYYDQSALAVANGLYFNAPFFIFNLFFPSEFSLLTLDDPFPAGFGFSLPGSGITYQRDLKTTYQQQWSVDLQQELQRDLLLGVSYVGSKGTNLVGARDLNQPLPSSDPDNPRPLPQFADINQLESSGNSTYHALQIRLQQRLSSGLMFLASYSWSHSIDSSSTLFPSAGDANFPQDSFNLRAEKGRSNFDIRHRLSFNYSYDLPFGRGRRILPNLGGLGNFILSGWQTNGIVTLQSGYPFTPILLADNSNTGTSLLGVGAGDRPHLVSNPKPANPGPDGWVDATAFALPPFGSFGNAGRNILTGPGFRNMDFSLLKTMKLTEDWNLQFRAEFFNLFNHPNFDLPNPTVDSPLTFGRIFSARSGLPGDARSIQFALKLIF